MLVPPLFKGPPCQTSIMFCAILGGDTSYVNHIVLLKFRCGQRAGELHPSTCWVSSTLSNLVLCLLTRLPMLGIHLYPILTVFLFKIFLRGLFCGNEVSIILKNCFPIFVFLLYNDLRHTHKQEMELTTCVCTSFYFCQLFTDH